jgi:hypothetical protein
VPHLFRTRDGQQWKPKDSLQLTLCDGTKVIGTWAGSATEEKLACWLQQPGNQLAQTDEVSEVAARADDTGETIWGAAPVNARLLFVVLAQEPGKNYRLAKMVTTAVTPSQIAYFRHPRFSLFGRLKLDGTIERISPLPPPPPTAPIQKDLF